MHFKVPALLRLNEETPHKIFTNKFQIYFKMLPSLLIYLSSHSFPIPPYLNFLFLFLHKNSKQNLSLLSMIAYKYVHFFHILNTLQAYAIFIKRCEKKNLKEKFLVRGYLFSLLSFYLSMLRSFLSSYFAFLFFFSFTWIKGTITYTSYVLLKPFIRQIST